MGCSSNFSTSILFGVSSLISSISKLIGLLFCNSLSSTLFSCFTGNGMSIFLVCSSVTIGSTSTVCIFSLNLSSILFNELFIFFAFLRNSLSCCSSLSFLSSCFIKLSSFSICLISLYSPFSFRISCFLVSNSFTCFIFLLIISLLLFVLLFLMNLRLIFLIYDRFLIVIFLFVYLYCLFQVFLIIRILFFLLV